MERLLCEDCSGSECSDGSSSNETLRSGLGLGAGLDELDGTCRRGRNKMERLLCEGCSSSSEGSIGSGRAGGSGCEGGSGRAGGSGRLSRCTGSGLISERERSAAPPEGGEGGGPPGPVWLATMSSPIECSPAEAPDASSPLPPGGGGGGPPRPLGSPTMSLIVLLGRSAVLRSTGIPRQSAASCACRSGGGGCCCGADGGAGGSPGGPLEMERSCDNDCSGTGGGGSKPNSSHMLSTSPP